MWNIPVTNYSFVEGNSVFSVFLCNFNLRCRSSPHRCHPCSRHRHHTSSGMGYSDRSYTETGHYHTSHHSRSAKYTHGTSCSEYLLFRRIIIEENSAEVCRYANSSWVKNVTKTKKMTIIAVLVEKLSGFTHVIFFTCICHSWNSIRECSVLLDKHNFSSNCQWIM